METAMKIRQWVLVDGKSMRSVAKETGLSRNTISKYCKDSTPQSMSEKNPQFVKSSKTMKLS